MKPIKVQFIEKDGYPEWAVISYELYKHFIGETAVLDDVAALDQAVSEGDGYRIPADMTFRIIEGVHPVKVWRQYRGLTQIQLAEKTGISKPYVSQIESGKRKGTVDIMTSLSQALDVPLDVLVPS